MSKHHAGETENGRGAAVNPFLAMWTACVEQANQQALATLETMQQGVKPQELRKKVFDAWASSLDSYLRSPMFLEPLKLNTDIANRLRTQYNQAGEELIRQMGLPHARDMAQLIDTVRFFESRVMERLDAIEERIGRLEQSPETATK